jgi:hypothetical protein
MASLHARVPSCPAVGTLARCATAFGVAEVRVPRGACARPFAWQRSAVAWRSRRRPALTAHVRPRARVQVLLVGERSFNTFGSHGAADHVAFRHFPTLAQARAAPHALPSPLCCLLSRAAPVVALTQPHTRLPRAGAHLPDGAARRAHPGR